MSKLKDDIEKFNAEVAAYEQQLNIAIAASENALSDEVQQNAEDVTQVQRITAAIHDAIEGMQKAKSREALDAYHDSLKSIMKQLDGNDLAAMKKLEHELAELAATRNLYLTRKSSLKRRLTDIAWLTGGIALLAATAAISIAVFTTTVVLGVTLPFLVVPAIVLGAAVLAYSTLDISKEFGKLISKATMPKLFKSKEKPLSKKQKIEKGLVLTASALGFGLAVVGLVAVIPALAIAPIVPIIMAVGALAICGALLTSVFIKHRRAKKSVSESQLAADKIQQDIQPTLKELKLKPKLEATLANTAGIERQLLGKRKLTEDKLEKMKSELTQADEEGEGEGESENEGIHPVEDDSKSIQDETQQAAETKDDETSAVDGESGEDSPRTFK